MAVCNNCKKSEPQVQLKSCAKCSKTKYCNRDCQKADWKAHKKVCGKQQDAGASGSGGSSGGSPAKGLDQPVSNPFTRLDTGTYLHGRPEKDVYRLLLDTYRLRMADNHNIEGRAENDSIYAGRPDGLAGFKRFMQLVAARDGLLPSWWTPEKQVECETFGMADEWQNLRRKAEKADIIDHYGDPQFPMQLRMLGEAVYGKAPGGSDGTSMRKMMAAMEGGNSDGMFTSLLDVSGGRRS